jgi:DNA topoisomerase-3
MQSDWLVGMNFTRLFTLKLGNFFSFGRVQVPLLSAIVEKTEARRRFVSHPYYRLRITLSQNGQSFFAYYVKSGDETFRVKHSLGRNPQGAFPEGEHSFPDRSALDKIASDIRGLPCAKVNSIHTVHKSLPSPQLYNLTSLQKDCSRFFGFRASYTAEIAQTLYEHHKVLSYPRSSSRVLSRSDHSMFCNIISVLTLNHPDIFRDHSLPSVDDTRIFDDTKLSDHHAITVLNQLPRSLSVDEKKVATLVLKSMAAVILPPYVYNAQVVDFDIGGNSFRSHGIRVVNLGWKQLFTSERSSTDSIEPVPSVSEDHFDTPLPALTEGESLSISSVDILDKLTLTPQPFSEARLLGFMEKYHLGTESTRAEILDTIVKRRYAIRSKAAIHATDKGCYFIRTILALPTEQVKEFANVRETATWEAMLESTPETFYKSIKIALEGSVTNLKDMSFGSYEQKPVGSCLLCGSPVFEGEYAYQCSSKQRCQFSISKVILGHTLSSNDIVLLLGGVKTRLAAFVSKSGKPFKAKLHYDASKQSLAFVYPHNTAKGGSQ